MFELRNEEINVKKILAVINATNAVAKRKPEKIRLVGIRTLTSAISVQRSITNSANKPTGSWLLNWFVIYPGKMKMKLRIYEIHMFELRNEEINEKKILAVINGFESRQA